MGLVKVFALLNLWFRERRDSIIVASEQDIDEAFAVWERIAPSQELNLPPYIYHLYVEVILAAYNERKAGVSSALTNGVARTGLSRKDVIQMHMDVYGRPLSDWLLRQQIIPMLEASGLIIQEPDPDDRRKMLIYPTTALTISPR